MAIRKIKQIFPVRESDGLVIEDKDFGFLSENQLGVAEKLDNQAALSFFERRIALYKEKMKKRAKELSSLKQSSFKK